MLAKSASKLYMDPRTLQEHLEAFNHIVLQHQELVYNQAYRLLGEADAAEDAAQEAFILAYRKFDSYRNGSLKAWLLRIVTNYCYDELRRWKRHPLTALEPINAEGEEIESPSWLIDPNEEPEQEMERAELGQDIQHCLNALPFGQRSVVILVDLQGLEYQEAARVMGISVGTVKSRLARARTRLRGMLLEAGITPA